MSALDGHPVLAPDVFDGFTLLEADAGTGKTWTLANLVLRALIERNASIDEIVVVTFTRKAAAELRDRIMRAIESLEAALAGDPATDPFIAAYLPRCEPGRDLHRLRRARALFEEAPISTIHGLCQRILAEQRLSIAQPAGAELRDIEQAQVEAGVQRWWRRMLVEEDAWTVGVLLAAGNSAARLARGLRRLLSDDSRGIAPPAVDRAWYASELRRLAEAAREALRVERDAYRAWLRSTRGINGRSYTESNIRRWFEQLAVSLDRLPVTLADMGTARARFGASAFAGVTQAPPPFALAGLLDEIDTLLARRAALRAGLLVELRERLAGEIAARKREERLQTYDDLLLLTRDALRDPAQGEALAQRLRRRYPIVFVDECQDTDPCQWEILRRLHAPTFRGEADAGLSLVLVGDPKQSIYAFRNADVFAYLSARTGARRRLRLTQNQRACDELVTGINALFASPGVFALDEIDFVEAQPGTRPRRKWRPPAGDGRRALNLVEVPAEASRAPEIEAAALAAMASEVAGLLSGARGEIVSPEGKTRAPTARDIAVLVRKAEEGERVKRALRERGIGAVEISRQSVFATRDAAELLRIIDAVADPASVSAMRAALLTAPIGYDAPTLEQAVREPLEWSRLVERFASAASAWRHVGPVAALRRLLFHDFAAASRLAADRDAERRLTNLMHLLELLGAMPEAREEAMLARSALAERIARAAEGRDETAELRLESDADLVQILTMHKSKGLEFPIVFIPFGWRGPGSTASDEDVEMHEAIEDGWRAVLVCGPRHDGEPEDLQGMRQRAEVEALSEAMRLMYVAITRAELRLYLFWTEKSKGGAVARLLGDAPRDRIEAMARAHPEAIAAFDCEALRESAGGAPAMSPARELAAREFRARVPAPWEERSYTGLMRAIRPEEAGLSLPATTVDAPRPDHDEWVPGGDDPGTAAVEVQEPGERPVRHVFPAGARAGTALHEVLETVDLAHPVPPDRVAEVLGRHGIDADAGAVAAWLDGVLDTPLRDAGGASLALRALDNGSVMRELKFTLLAEFAGARDRTRRIVDIVRGEFPIDGRLLSSADWHGYLGGFIDLVFEADGRYWILDWKSNRLGADDAAYGPAALADSIARHGYALQFCLYTLAIHRLLGSRRADYDYDRHFGGVFYAFLRGMTGTADRGVHFARPTRGLVEALDAQLSGVGEGGRR